MVVQLVRDSYFVLSLESVVPNVGDYVRKDTVSLLCSGNCTRGCRSMSEGYVLSRSTISASHPHQGQPRPRLWWRGWGSAQTPALVERPGPREVWRAQLRKVAGPRGGKFWAGAPPTPSLLGNGPPFRAFPPGT